ncbi:MAG: hypothetical protein E6005_03705 [Peptostreptococcus sp.]|uniref:hypothetical protein n=1 Tax=Peptostreptococcus TaxID=1257 RepID=UPI001897AB66|nr:MULTISPECIES: hypothetical protein [Peptostreptococcus]MDB8821416.1 hypothetical protein [Peptostreptococcus anaerobius]MDB8825938.1 hypothetical protein [Peptostreptococcus anaerobius]MDB8827901.1 hypothetical protein [Peptostreptococcus anaerobius]MDB8829719.1 hypothetical protein [Peptostreptococcus anaerobius]MDB8831581.1 hypothetical protein [Peptostreptococcus anaerobius]
MIDYEEMRQSIHYSDNLKIEEITRLNELIKLNEQHYEELKKSSILSTKIAIATLLVSALSLIAALVK